VENPGRKISKVSLTILVLCLFFPALLPPTLAQQGQGEAFPGNERTALEQQRRVLEDELNAIEIQRKALTDDCSHVRSDDATRNSQCSQRRQQLLFRIQKYKADLETLEKRTQAFEQFDPVSGQSRGTVGFIKGEVYKSSKAGQVPLNGSSSLAAGDEVQTGPNSRVELVFTDGSKLLLDANAVFRIAEIKSGRSVYDIIKGRIHAIVEGYRTRNNEILYRTRFGGATAVISVRGTEFSVDAKPDGTTIIVVLHGLIEINESGSGKFFKVGGGELLTMTAKGAYTGPSTINLRSMAKWWE